MMKSLERCVAAALLAAAPVLVSAQGTPTSAPSADDAVERLGRYIRILTGSPRDVSALIGAGQAALDVGDPNAALGFFARADAVNGSSARVKAGLASALVQIERPDDALRLFGEAVLLGASERDIARDRGLAYDLRGDSARAQRDYALAETRGTDDELIRRYALSLGISGNRAAALAKLDPLLRRQDQGAWRARAFILAMTGDVPGANGVARALMPVAMAESMSPLLSRLATLNAAGRAHAVNFGTIPSDGTQIAANVGDPYLAVPLRVAGSPPVAMVPSRVAVVGARDPVVVQPVAPTVATGSGLIPRGEPLGPRGRPAAVAPPSVATASIVPDAPRRRPGEVNSATVAAALPPVPAVLVPVVAPLPTASPPSAVVARPVPSPTPAPAPTQITAVALPPSTVAGAPATPITGGPAPFEVELPRRAEVAGPPAAGASVVAAAPITPTTVIAAPTVAPPAASRLAGLLSDLTPEPDSTAELPSARELRAARAAAKRKLEQQAAAEAAAREAKAEQAKAAEAARRNPARLWVQVATGANDSGLALTWKRLRTANDDLLGSQSAWSAPFKATNRVLVGPMKSPAAARELVRALGKNGVSAMTYGSEAGEEVSRIGGK